MSLPSPTLSIVLDRHLEDATFLFLQWDAAVNEPHHNLNDLEQLEERLNAHLDGLQVAGEIAWQPTLTATQTGEPGEIFVAAWLATLELDSKKLDQVLSTSQPHQDTINALVSAIAWYPLEYTRPWLTAFIAANDPLYQALGLALFTHYRVDPGQSLVQALETPHALTLSPALRAIGELKRQDLQAILTLFTQNENPDLAYLANWSAALLGDWSAVANLTQLALQNTPHAEQAIKLAARKLSHIERKNLLETLSENADTTRLAIQGMGYSGDPFWLPVILKHMHDLNLARVAGEAFSLITGLDLAYLDMDRDWPEGFESGPNEDPLDDNVELDADLNLPWPDSAKIQEWWQANAAQFTSGQRYLCGKPIDKTQCYQVLKNGYQRQRHAAALELALMGEPYFNVCAPAKRQKALLEHIANAD
ncbi:TIGR02270 family protein [Bowmanella denitrificans]|uniref:TIGR02270 family protein n=1 Tax=Bowmanella denitrificans TaxID=366582 RepID=A0ABN0X9Z6_9ALTE